MDIVITPRASKWAVFWTLIALGIAMIAGHNIVEDAPVTAKLVASALMSIATITVIMVYTIKSYHKADVDAGKLAVTNMQVMANDMELLKKATILAKDLMKQAQEQLKEVGKEGQTLAKEVELLRKSEQKLLADLAKAKKDIAKANDETAKAQSDLANANKRIAKANDSLADEIAKAKVNAKKEHLPYINAGENYLLYSVCKGISRPNSSHSKEDRAMAEKHFKELKTSLDAFKEKYKSVAEKTILG